MTSDELRPSQQVTNAATTRLRSTMRRLIVALCYLAAFVVVMVALRSSFVSLPELSPRNIVLFSGMAAMTFPLMAMRGELNRITFRLGRGLRQHWDGFCLAVWNTTANLFPFSPGLATKGLLLHRMYSVRMRDYVSLTFLVFLTAITASGLSALYSLALLRSSTVWLWTGFTCLSLAAIPCWPAARKRLPRINLLSQLVGDSIDFSRPWGLLILVHVILVHFEAWRLFIAFAISGYQSVSFAAIVVMTSGTILTRIANVTPGAIGIREGIIVGLASTTNIPVEVSVVAAAVDRVAAIAGLALTFLLVASVEAWRNRSASAAGRLNSTAAPTSESKFLA